MGYDLDLFKSLIGDWETEMLPGLTASVCADNKRLFYKNNIDSIVGQFYIFSKKKLMGENRVFFTIVNEGDEIIVRQTGENRLEKSKITKAQQ